jgi:hypothetical protein
MADCGVFNQHSTGGGNFSLAQDKNDNITQGAGNVRLGYNADDNRGIAERQAEPAIQDNLPRS